MNVIISIFGTAVALAILSLITARWIGRGILDRTVEFHTQHLDQEINDLLNRD